MEFLISYLRVLELLTGAHPQNAQLHRLAQTVRTDAVAKTLQAHAMRELEPEALAARDPDLLEHLGLSFPNLPLAKMVRALDDRERVQFWSLLDGLRTATVPKQRKKHSEMLVFATNKQVVDLTETLCKAFPGCDPLLEFAVSLRTLNAAEDPRFVEALTQDMDSDERVEQLKNRDPQMLAGLVRTFPGVEMERLHANMTATDRNKFWPALQNLVTTTMVQAPMEVAFPEMEEKLKDAMESAKHMDIDMDDKAQLASHSFSRLMASHKLTDMHQMLGMLRDKDKMAVLQRFLNLNNAKIDLNKMLGGQTSEQEMSDALQAVSQMRMPMMDSLGLGALNVDVGQAMESMKEQLSLQGLNLDGRSLEEVFGAQLNGAAHAKAEIVE